MIDNSGGSDNTAIGAGAMFSNNDGSYNVAIGSAAMFNHQFSAYSVAIGYEALADPSNNTIFTAGVVGIGSKAMRDASGGLEGNIAIGYESLLNTEGTQNIGIGTTSLRRSTGSDNIAIGNLAGTESVFGNPNTGSKNVAIGPDTLQAPTFDGAIAIGYQAMQDVTDNSYSIAIGYEAMTSASGTGRNNVAIGHNSMKTANSRASIAIGNDAMRKSTNHDLAIAIGGRSMEEVSSGADNIAVGYESLQHGSSLQYNIALGWKNLRGITGSTNSSLFNTCIGYESMRDVSFNVQNNVVIGKNNMIQCENLSNNVIIGDNCLPNSNTGLNGNILIGDSIDLSNSVVNTTCIGSGVTSDVSNEVVIGNGDVTVWRNDGNGTCDLGASGNPFKDVYLNCGVISDVSRIIFCDPSGSSISSGNSIDISTNALNVGSAPVYSSYSADTCGNALANQQWVLNNAGSDLSGITQTDASGSNTALGVNADPSANGVGNVAIGFQALYDPSGAIFPSLPEQNVVVGADAFSNLNGNTVTALANNVVIGTGTASDISGTVSNNIIIGTAAQPSAEGIEDNIVIGNGGSGFPPSVGPGVQNTTCIGKGVQVDVSNEVVIGNSEVTVWRNDGSGTCDLGSEAHNFQNLYLSGDISAVATLRFADGTQQSTAATGGGGGSDLSGITQNFDGAELANTALGVNANPTTNGVANVAIGFQALHDPSGAIFDPQQNVVVGAGAFSDPSGSQVSDANNNVVIGYEAAKDVSGAILGNVIIGTYAQEIAHSITNNVVIGINSLVESDVSSSIVIGTGAEISTSGVLNSIVIGSGATTDLSNEVVLGNNFVTTIRNGGNDTCDLGTETNQFKNLYLTGDISGATNINLTGDISGAQNINLFGDISGAQNITLAPEGGGVITFQDGTQQSTAATGGTDLSGITQIGPSGNTALGVDALPFSSSAKLKKCTAVVNQC